MHSTQGTELDEHKLADVLGILIEESVDGMEAFDYPLCVIYPVDPDRDDLVLQPVFLDEFVSHILNLLAGGQS